MSSDAKQNLLLFFDRPLEPCFMQKGEEKAVLQLPDRYYPDKYKEFSVTLSDRFGEGSTRAVPIRDIALPDITLPMQLPYNDQFSVFVPSHRKMAAKLIDIFMGMRNLEDLQSVCAYCQLRINPYMFNYCLSVAILHRDDTKGLDIPTFVETFPDKFVDPKAIRRARELTTTTPIGNRMPIVIPQRFTASDLEPEQRVAYFREDMGINLHHWHWHLVYPFDAADRAIVNKDRRGELFCYMHEQIIARYNTERFCNKLRRVTPLGYREPIAEGYFPKLDSMIASRTWPPRYANSRLHDLNRPMDQVVIDISQLEAWDSRFRQAVIEKAVMLPNGQKVPLVDGTGIDILGNLLESSIISLNRSYYGDLHNNGHVFISYCHDPNGSNLELFAVMGDTSTSMRDPAFYHWHKHIDDMFQLFKDELPAYSFDQLDFPGIRVSSISIRSPRGKNVFSTFWQQSTVDMARGLDFAPRGSVLASFTHLQHEEYVYRIDVKNTSGRGEIGTVRIFMAPKFDEDGRPMTFNEQRRFMIELDKFTHSIPTGTSTITRRSTDSSVTIPYERTFRNQDARPGAPGSQQAAQFDFCGCGWPQHMLIPKGTPEGFSVVLFVMISNWEKDGIQQNLVGNCNDAASYCGIRDRKYPDRRPMGFPFDRPARVSNLTDFLVANMTFTNCTIRFTDVVRQRGQKA